MRTSLETERTDTAVQASLSLPSTPSLHRAPNINIPTPATFRRGVWKRMSTAMLCHSLVFTIDSGYRRNWKIELSLPWKRIERFLVKWNDGPLWEHTFGPAAVIGMWSRLVKQITRNLYHGLFRDFSLGLSNLSYLRESVLHISSGREGFEGQIQKGEGTNVSSALYAGQSSDFVKVGFLFVSLFLNKE